MTITEQELQLIENSYENARSQSEALSIASQYLPAVIEEVRRLRKGIEDSQPMYFDEEVNRLYYGHSPANFTHYRLVPVTLLNGETHEQEVKEDQERQKPQAHAESGSQWQDER